MCAATSRASRKSGLHLPEEIAAFEGCAELMRCWSQGIRPDPDLTVSQWADRHRWLSARASAEPGRYRTVRTPYIREIMDRLSPADPAQRIVFMKAAQVGAPLALDTPVPTPFGWTTMGEITQGDLLYDEQGKICQVTGLSAIQIDRPCFAVDFDDGEQVGLRCSAVGDSTRWYSQYRWLAQRATIGAYAIMQPAMHAMQQ